MRYEKKFKISTSEFSAFLAIINKFKFINQYQSRFISSIYYDTTDFNLYKDSINGVSERKKYRARFYNNDFKEINLEEKVKIADLGYKNIYRMNELDHLSKIRLFLNKKNNFDDLLIPLRLFGKFFPVSFVNYFRSYFISYDGKTRITLDEKINYSKIINNKKCLYLSSIIPDKLGVIEIKYDKEDAISEKSIFNFTASLNLHLSRNSKYCNSIEALY